MNTYGMLSFLPVIVAVVIALLTREVISSLLAGIFIGAFILHKGNVMNELLYSYLIKVGISDNAKWIITIFLIGGIIGILRVSGGFSAFGDWAQKKIKTRKEAQIITWIGCLIVFLSPSLHCLTLGTVMKPITDKFRVSREKLSYLVDATGATLSALIPVSTWTPYLVAFIIQNSNKTDGMIEVLKAIPFNFYALSSIVMTGLVASGVIPDWGLMKKAEDRAKEKGQVIRPGSRPLVSEEVDTLKVMTTTPKFINFILPMGVIFGVAVWTFLFKNTVDIVLAFLIASIVAVLLYVGQGLMKPRDYIDSYVEGIKAIVPACLILILAFALSGICKDLGLAAFVIESTQGLFSPNLLPTFAFIVASLIAIPTGTSFGTMAVLFPVILPLAVATGAPFSATVAATIGGAAFGDHISPISDTTILSSMSSGCDHVDHVMTQLPYALTCAGISLFGYLILAIV